MTGYFVFSKMDYLYGLLSLGPEYHVLGSHHEFVRTGCLSKWQEIYQDPKRNIFFLDSGAFSVKHSNLPLIQIKDYIATIEALKPHVYATMDVIGNAKATYNNTCLLWAENYKPLPVLHLPSPVEDVVRYTELYLDKHGCRHIAVGGVARTPYRNKEVQKKLALFWGVVKKYWPVKVHLFGTFDARWLMDYPYHSCDSSTWTAPGRWGKLSSVVDHLSFKMKSTHHSDPLRRREGKYELWFRNRTLPRSYIKEKGFLELLPNQLNSYVKVGLIQAIIYKEILDRVTNYWVTKGVTWEPIPLNNAKPPRKHG